MDSVCQEVEGAESGFGLSGYVHCIYWIHSTQKKHVLWNINQFDKENDKEVGAAKLVQKIICYKHIMFSLGSCGHFALGTSSTTCSKAAVSDINNL